MKAKRIIGAGLLLSLVTIVGLVFATLSLLPTQASAQEGASIDVEAIDPLRTKDHHHRHGHGHDLEWSYAAKFLCGIYSDESDKSNTFLPGLYLTDLEILNTTRRRVDIQLAAGVAEGMDPTPLDEKRIWHTLQKDEGLQYDCLDILSFLGIAILDIETFDGEFFKGWIVVRSKPELHVTAVYMLETIR